SSCTSIEPGGVDEEIADAVKPCRMPCRVERCRGGGAVDGRNVAAGSIDAPAACVAADRTDRDGAGDACGDRLRPLCVFRKVDLGHRRQRNLRHRAGVRLCPDCPVLPIGSRAMTEDEIEEPLITPLVKALTRAPTLMGVPYMYFMFNGVVSSICFLLS